MIWSLSRSVALPLSFMQFRCITKRRTATNTRLILLIRPGMSIFRTRFPARLPRAEGAILVVDASQGVEAQTISNLYLAIDAGLEIIPVINKIDLPSAMIDNVKHQIMDLIGCKEEEIILATRK